MISLVVRSEKREENIPDFLGLRLETLRHKEVFDTGTALFIAGGAALCFIKKFISCTFGSCLYNNYLSLILPFLTDAYFYVDSVRLIDWQPVAEKVLRKRVKFSLPSSAELYLSRVKVSMSYETPEAFQPILESELTEEMKTKFRLLWVDTFNYMMLGYGEYAPILRQHITEEVTQHPILARTISKQTEDSSWSLLRLACFRTGMHCREFIQFLIERNPHALLWAPEDSFRRGDALLHIIASNSNCLVFPWIAERYPWVFQHPLYQQSPPHLKMMKLYINGHCDETTVQSFYEIYPQGLQERDTAAPQAMYPLMLSLSGSEEPSEELFVWMAEQYPNAVYHSPVPGFTILHKVCSILAKSHTLNMTNICRFLLVEHASLISQTTDEFGHLPIHELASSCNNRPVRLMVCGMLKEYPECVNVKDVKLYPDLSEVPFIKQVHPLIVEALDIEKEISLLTEMSDNILKAVSLLTCNSLPSSEQNGSSFSLASFGSLAEVFSCWAKLRITHVLSPLEQKNRAEAFRLVEEGVPGDFEEEDDDADSEEEDGDDDSDDDDGIEEEGDIWDEASAADDDGELDD